MRIDVKILGEEVLLRLETLPKRLREQLYKKMGVTLETARADLFQELPGKYLDPKYVNVTVEQTGSLLIGTLEAIDKEGTYPIDAKNTAYLQFVGKEDGALVYRKHVDHPFLKGGPVIERYFREHKPWLIEQVEDAVFDTVYNGR